MRYRAVLFDLFDTLVHFHRDRLPVVELQGRTVRSSVGPLHAVLASHAPGVTLDACYEALMTSWQEAERLRAIDHREVTARQRFAHLLRCLAVQPTGEADLVEALLVAHQRELRRAAELPPHHRPLLRQLAARYRLAVVSNFDYTPTARAILAEAGVSDLFSAIVISDEVGWRKPKAEIFHEALRRVGAGPDEALFVGDRADIDVLGAQRVGMDVAWANPAREPLPERIAPPRFEIRDLAELSAILES